jgi:3-oxoacyl-[acyl-carrier protein] reductase
MPNVIVTGGSRGLGLAIAKRLCAGGHDVIAVARRETDALTEAMGTTASAGRGSLHFVSFDLGCTGELPELVKHIRGAHGPIFGLVNNAAIGTSGVLATMRDADIEALIRINTLSPVMLTKYVARSMMAGQGGRIVNMSSIVGSQGYSGLAVYGATKASLIGLTRSLARELGPLGVTVNAVAPGFISTEMTSELGDEAREKIARRSALRRMAEVDDVASAIEFLLSDRAKNITGTTITVDAGNTA